MLRNSNREAGGTTRLARPLRLMALGAAMVAAQVGLMVGSGSQTALALAGISIPIGVVDPSGLLYIASSGNNSMVVYDETKKAVVASASVGGVPYGIDVNFTSNRIFVANSADNTISGLDATTYATKFTVPSGGISPHGVAVDQAHNRVGITNYNSNNVAFIDGSGNRLALVATPAKPEAIANDPGLGRYYTANSGGQSVSVISAKGFGMVATVSLPGWAPQAIAADPASHRVFVAAASASSPTTSSGALFVLNGSSFVTEAPGEESDSDEPDADDVSSAPVVSQSAVGVNPHGVSFASGRVLTTNQGLNDGTAPGSLTDLFYDSTYTTLSSTKTTTVPPRPFGITYSPSVQSFFSVNQGSPGDPGSVSQVDPNGNVTYTANDTAAPQLTFDPPGSQTVTGKATDNASGVASIIVTFTPATGTAISSAASLACPDSSNLSCTWSAPQPTTRGQYTYAATATDRAGNRATYTSPYPIRIGDYTPPKATFNPPSGGNVTGGATDDSSGVASVLVTFTAAGGGASSSLATLTCDNSSLACTWSTAAPTGPGQYSYTATVTDRATNQATYSSPFTVTNLSGSVDGAMADSSLTATCLPPAGAIANGVGKVCGKINVGSGTATVTVIYTPTNGVGTASRQSSTTAFASGPWAITVNAAPGTYNVTAVATATGSTTSIPLGGSVLIQVV